MRPDASSACVLATAKPGLVLPPLIAVGRTPGARWHAGLPTHAACGDGATALISARGAQVLTALAAEQPALLEWHLARHPKRALALCIAQIGRDPDDSFDGVAVRAGAGIQAVCAPGRGRRGAGQNCFQRSSACTGLWACSRDCMMSCAPVSWTGRPRFWPGVRSALHRVQALPREPVLNTLQGPVPACPSPSHPRPVRTPPGFCADRRPGVLVRRGDVQRHGGPGAAAAPRRAARARAGR